MSYLFPDEDDTSGWDMSAVPMGDVLENVKMSGTISGNTTDAFGNSTPWWQSMIQTGVSKLIDNRLGPTNVSGNSNPGSFAGQNGATYPQDIASRTPSVGNSGTKVNQSSGMGMLLLLGIGALLMAGS